MAARWLLAGALLVASVGVSHAQLRLMGLDRFYFDHMAGPGDQLPGLLLVIDSLPDNLRWPTIEAVEDEDGTIVQDFPIDGLDSERQVWVREIRVTTKGGVDIVWWALYDGGLRSDLWTYAANRIRHDGKVLNDYRLHSIVQAPSEPTAPKSLLFQVRGELDAKDGWRRSGFEWTLSQREDSLVVSGCRTVFDLYRPAEGDSSIEASAETASGDQVQVAHVKSTPDLLAACGLSDPGEAAWEFSWTQLSEAAQCLLGGAEAQQSTRSPDARTFIERGSGE